jgi:molybdopterin converting factor small subunit
MLVFLMNLGDPMEITLILYGFLKKYMHHDEPNEPNNNQIIKIDRLKLIEQILEENHIPIKEVGFILKGNKTVNLDYQVQNGDVIKVFPPIAGG